MLIRNKLIVFLCMRLGECFFSLDLRRLVHPSGGGIYAILLGTKADAARLLRALISFLIFPMFVGTQWSVTVPFFMNNDPASDSPVCFAGCSHALRPDTSIAYGLQESCGGPKAAQANVLRSLLGVVVFGVGVAPHTAVMILPIISAEDRSNRPGTLTRVGDPAPDFELATVEGTPFHTVDLRGG